MEKVGPLPPPLTQHDLTQGEKLLAAAASEPKQPLTADPALGNSLYYPLRQVPLPGFQFEMLVWHNDKLNVFGASQAPLEFRPPVAAKFDAPVIRYRRVDAFTVLAIACAGSACVVYTNEISQSSWELIGAFCLRGLEGHLAANKRTLVDYSDVERSFARARAAQSDTKSPSEPRSGDGGGAGSHNIDGSERSGNAGDDNDDDDEAYWNRYKDSSSNASGRGMPRNSSFANNSLDEESSYWDRHAQRSPVLDDGSVREDAVRVLVSLAALYADCGVDARHAAEDLRCLAVGEQPPAVLPVAALLARRHAVRTLDVIKADATAFDDELLLALRQIRDRSA